LNRAGELSLGSSAVADAITSRAVPVLSACSVRARRDVECGDKPRYGSVRAGKRHDEAGGVGIRNALEGREEKRASGDCSTSASVSATSTTRSRPAAAAANAFAAGVSPLTPLPGTPVPAGCRPS
jgi:hypothetical protein